MRYYVYSIEYGYMPNNPYYEDNDVEACIIVAEMIHDQHNVCAYVVDRESRTPFAEIYVKISSDFRRQYREMQVRIKEI